jgi:transposase
LVISMEDAVVIGNEELQSAHTRAPEFRGEVLSGPERRRRWSIEEKLRVLAQSVAPGSSPSLTCRLHGISSGQLYTWRKQFRTGELTGFIPVVVGSEPAAQLSPPVPIADAPLASSAAPHSDGLIEVELPSGVKLRLTGDVDEAALRRVLSALS